MKQSYIFISVATCILGLVGGYVIGLWQANSTPVAEREQFAALSPEERQARFAERGAGARMGRVLSGDGVANGEVVAKDAQAVTVALRDGGSKIVFFGDSTAILKTTSGSSSDVLLGSQVTVLGTTNPDGSMSAATIQIRPEGGMTSTN